MKLPNLHSPVISGMHKYLTLQALKGIEPQKQKCWSASKCSGKVLSNRDYHNCCTKSSGTSWSDRDGNCYRC